MLPIVFCYFAKSKLFLVVKFLNKGVEMAESNVNLNSHGEVEMGNLNNLSQIEERLKSNPMFHFSLSSKELFHSNFLAWLWDNKRKSGNEFLKSFVEKIGDENNARIISQIEKNQYIIEREKNHIDLTIIIHEDNAKKINNEIPINLILTKIYIELKVKSLPDYDQLDDYYNKLTNNNRETFNKFFIFLSLENIKEFKDVDHFESKEIWKNFTLFDIFDVKNEHNLYITDYIKLINNLKEYLLEYFKQGIKSENKFRLELKNEVKLNDFVQKYYSLNLLKFFNNNEKLKDKVKEGPKNWINVSEINSWYSGVGFSNGTFNLALYKKFQNANHEIFFLGIQIQGDQYRLFIESLNHNEDFNYTLDLLKKSNNLLNPTNIWIKKDELPIDSLFGLEFDDDENGNKILFKNKRKTNKNSNEIRQVHSFKSFLYQYFKIKSDATIEDIINSTTVLIDYFDKNQEKIVEDLYK